MNNKMSNCPVCNSEINKSNIDDCGYSQFNIGHILCKNCDFKITLSHIEDEQGYINSWNNIINNLNEVLSLKDKDSFIKYLLLKDPLSLSTSYTYYKKGIELNNNKEYLLNKKIIEENNLNLKISDSLEILVPKELLKFGYKEILNKLGITLKIRSV